MSTEVTRRGSIPQAMAWMVGLSIALFWVPLVGSLIAGFVGGRKAGGLARALAAVFLPGVALFLVTVLLSGLLGWIPIIGQLVSVVAGLGAWALGFVNVIPLAIGAAIGGATSR